MNNDIYLLHKVCVDEEKKGGQSLCPLKNQTNKGFDIMNIPI